MDIEQVKDDVVKSYLNVMKAWRQCLVPDWLNSTMSMAQLRVLFLLKMRGPLTISMLAEQLHVGQPTASHLVERLVRIGFVTRAESATDRRQTLASLTAEGEETISSSRLERHERIHSQLAQLTEEELIALQTGLHALLRVIPHEDN